MEFETAHKDTAVYSKATLFNSIDVFCWSKASNWMSCGYIAHRLSKFETLHLTSIDKYPLDSIRFS